MKRRITLIGLTIAILLPFLTNILGWNFYAYLNLGKKDLILASALGLSHNAWAESIKEELGFDLPDHFTVPILEAGILNLFLERRLDPMTPFAFRLIKPDRIFDYRGFEFPWLLLLIVPLATLLAPKFKKMQRKRVE